MIGIKPGRAFNSFQNVNHPHECKGRKLPLPRDTAGQLWSNTLAIKPKIIYNDELFPVHMTQIKVNYTYEVLLCLLKRNMHGRELAKEMDTSLTRVQSILNDLRQANAIDYHTEGKNHVYFINKNAVSKAFVLSSEYYKLTKLITKYPLIEQLINEICKKAPGKIIILFGSYARFSPKEDSDIDLFIPDIDDKTRIILARLHQNLSIKTGDLNKDDLLIQEIMKNHVIIQGAEQYHDRFFG
jgi:predicted nucleotidyltransferase